MPSPFPGMDPYLEDPGLWRDVHARLIVGSSDVLTGSLRPRYAIRVEDRVYVSNEDDVSRSEYLPDLQIVSRTAAAPPMRPDAGNGRSVGVVEPFLAATQVVEEIREHRLEIVDRESRRVVTVIEILSPTNKVAGSSGQKSFRQKRDEVLASKTHWVEIDLLRRGVPIWVDRPLPPHQYLVHVSKAEDRPIARLWPTRLDQPLPAIPIPLDAGDPEAALDLQAVLDAVYDRADYGPDIDYRKDPVPPLEGEWAAWADRLLKEKGLRPGSD